MVVRGGHQKRQDHFQGVWVPPPWIVDILGAEAAWALVRAAIGAVPGCSVFCDCHPCVSAMHKGRAWATGDRRRHARVHAMALSACDDVGDDWIVSVPAIAATPRQGSCSEATAPCSHCRTSGATEKQKHGGGDTPSTRAGAAGDTIPVRPDPTVRWLGHVT